MSFKRLIAGVVLILFLFLLCSNFAADPEYHSIINELAFNFQGNQFVDGLVSKVYHDGFNVSVNETGITSYYLVKTPFRVVEGDNVYVLGTLDSPHVITGEKIIIVKKDEFASVIIRSIIGLALFLIIFLTYWRFDIRKMIFKRRK